MKILFYEPYGQWHLHVIWETTLSHALQMRGAQVKHITCDGIFRECDAYRENINPRTASACDTCQKIAARAYSVLNTEFDTIGRYIPDNVYPELDKWLQNIPDDQLPAALWQGYPVGEWAKSSVIYQFRIVDLDLSNPVIAQKYRHYVFGTALSIEGLSRLYAQWQPDVLVLLNGRFFSHRVAKELAVEAGIRVITHDRGFQKGSLTFRADAGIHDLNAYHTLWDEWKDISLTRSELDQMRAIAEGRRQGTALNWKPFSPPLQETTTIKRALNLDDKPIVAVFTSSYDEVAVFPEYRQGAFPNPFDWLPELFKIIPKFPDYNFVIRLHPNLTAFGISQQALDQAAVLQASLPENARLVMPGDDISSYTLADMAVLGLVYFSTIGLEMALRGQPVVAVATGIYGHCDFIRGVNTPADYEPAIRTALTQGRQIEVARKAYRFAYQIFNNLSVPYPLVTEKPEHYGRLQFSSLDELAPDHHKELDRICAYILSGEPILLSPRSTHLQRSDNDETEYFQQLMLELDNKPLSSAPVTSPEPACKISVIIPTYNRSDILLKCLGALQNQTIPPQQYEVIVSDDGSTDNTGQLVRQYQPAYQLHYLAQQNAGPAAARNAAMRIASGKYFLFLNDDAIAAPDLLEQHLAAHRQMGNRSVAVLGDFDFPTEWLDHSPILQAFGQTNLVFSYNDMLPGNLYGYMRFWTANVSIDREVCQAIGDFDEVYKFAAVEDTEWGYRLEEAGCQVLYHPAAKTTHLHNMSSIDKFCRRQRLVAANFAHFFATHPEALHQPSWQEIYPINQQALQAHLAQYESGLDRVLTEAKKLETFDLKLIANNPATTEKLVTAARDLLIYLHRYYWYSGLLDGLQQYGIDSFAEFERIRAQSRVKISVIIPTYNRSEILLKCLGALSRQTLPADQFEVLVCDDGSTDQTRAIVENHSSSYALTYIWQQNSGPAAARNKGVRAARGEYILFINDDTILAPGALAAHLQAHREKGQQKMAVLGTFVYVPAAQRSPFVYFLEQTDIVFAYPMMQPGQFYNYRFFWTCNLSLKRQALLDVGLFDEDFVEPMVEDTELGYRLEKLGYAVLYHPAAQAHHDHTMNIHSFIRRQEMSGRNVVKLFQKHPELLPREKQLFGFDNLAEPTLEKFRHYLQQHEPVVPELIKKFDEMEQFNVDQLKTVVSANNGKSVTAADEFVEIMKTGIWPIHFTSFYRGILQATAHNGHTPAQQYSTGRPQPEPVVPLKILFVMYGWADDGGGTMLPRQMATSLAQKGHQVAVVYAAARPANGQPAYHVEEHWEKGVRLFGIYNRQSLFLDVENPDRESDDPQARQIVSQIIEHFQPDVVHYHNLLGLSMGIAADVAHMGLPSLYTSHNYWPLCPRLYLFQQDLALCGGPSTDGGKCAACLGQPEKQPAFARRVAAGQQMLNRHVDRHLAISTRARQLFVENGIEAGRIHVLHQSTQMIDQIWAQVGQPRPPLPALNRPLRVGFLGSLLPHKGVHVLVDALQNFTKTEVEAHIFGAGPDNYVQTLKSLDKKRLAKFHGAYQPEQLAQILSQVDVSVIPSIWEEGAGLVVVEALAARVPVIGSRSGGIPDFIRPGHNGFLFNPGDAGDLAAQLRQFLADPGLLGRLQAQINPPQTFDAFLDKLLGHYRQVIQAQPKGSRKDLPLNTNEQPLNRIRFDQNLGHGFSNRVAGGKLPQPLPQPLYLNLGCGNDIRPGFVNIDLFSDDPGVVGMDVRRLDLPDNCADGIIASDILEHFSHREVDAVLREWARVLKPGGELVVRSPSLRLQAKAYLNGVWDADIASYMIFGGQTNPGDYHCIGFDEASIRKHLAQAGLAVARFEEVDTPQDKSFINLNLTVWATKPQPVAAGPLPTSPTTEPVSVVWEGSQFVTHSLALINREVAIRLGRDSQIELSLLPFEPHQFGPEADPRFAVIANHLNRPLSRPAQVHVRHQWPPSFTPPAEGHWVVIQPWEFGSLPKQWVQVFASQVDEMWVPSNYVRDSYIRSGVPAERVFTVHNGLNLDQFRPSAPPYPLKTRKKFKFLFVGGTILRKGIDILLEVYSRTYSADDDVCLVIKDMGGDSFYQGRNARQHIEQLQAQPGAPEIEYISAILSDAELAGLYTACDCLVHPYRGEGFGLPIAEAMASGLPVIVTGHGAALDYCHPGNAYLIPAREVRLPEKRIGDWETVDWPWWAEPDAAALQLLMRRVLNNPTDAAAKAKVGMAEVRANFSWDKMAAAIKERLLVLRNQPIRRRAATPADAVETMQRLLQPGQAALAAGNLPAAAEAFRQVAEANPEFAAAFVAWGSTLQALGRLAEAAPVLRRAAELVPTLPDLPNQLGVIYVQLAEWEQAEAAFWQAHQLAPEDVNTLLNLIDLYRAAGNYDAASEIVNRALAVDPAHSDVLLAFGQICADLGDVGGVELAIERLHGQPGADALRQRLAGAAPAPVGDGPQAAATPNNGHQQNPTATGLESSAFDEQLARVQAAGDWPAAIELLNAELARHQTDADLWNSLGVAYVMTGQLEAAEDALRQGLAVAPEHLPILHNLADIYLQLEAFDQATGYLNRALRIDPNDVPLLLSLGNCAIQLGGFDTALAAFERVRELAPDTAGIDEVLAELAALQ